MNQAGLGPHAAAVTPTPSGKPGDPAFSVITFSVLGLPQTAGSKRSFPFRGKDGALHVRVTDDNPKGKAWRTVIQDRAREAYQGPLLERALCLRLTFTLPRPKGHWGKRGLLPSAPSYPTVKPDVLKLARAVEDALTGVIWRDDALIVDEQLVKEYGEPAGVRVSIDVGLDRGRAEHIEGTLL